MPKFRMGVELRPYDHHLTARMGGDAGATPMSAKDNGKLVKRAGGSRYDMCAVGDRIGGVAVQVGDLTGTYDGYVLGEVMAYRGARFEATADGSQAAGTGSIAVGDYVVCGTVVAKGTDLAGAAPKVRKATNQPGAVPADLTAAGDQAAVAASGWVVVEILSGTGAVGDKILVERQ